MEEPNTTHAGENGENNGGNRQRRGGRTRGERRRPRGGRDFTAPRDAASEDDEEEDGGGPQGGPNGGASPSGREGASVPPGFGSQHGIAGTCKSTEHTLNHVKQCSMGLFDTESPHCCAGKHHIWLYAEETMSFS